MFRPGSPLPSTGRAAESTTDGARPGQPRPMEDTRQPSAAERVRTLVESNASAALNIPGTDLDELGASAPAARTVTPDGDVLLLVPGDSPAARAAAHAQDDDLTAVIEITDVAPVAVPHRIRGRGWVAGWLTPVRNEERAACAMLLAEQHPLGALLEIQGGLGIDEALDQACASGDFGRPAWMLLRLEVGEAAVDDLWGAEQVEPDDFAEAEADPLAPHETDLLQHLAAAHSDQVRGLCALLGDRTGEACGLDDRAVPVALDRFGLRVRFTDVDNRSFDARFDFPEPVRDVVGLRRAMHTLFEAAHES
ncbi:DUF2470 domain-containing protein [Streptomyces pathocidini]|uniref:DUF2470 domain-containing protein n=1 Tax=Streptomyces pathocidini TaxID=1650571 RepID=A0ABW7UQD9_9ACTN|nr:DUF2470 domain-containing protein [Streptomyces pathocidini]